MSLTKECQEYHLTPRGWIAGDFHRDFGKNEIPIPGDRVLTIHCIDELTSAFSEPIFRDYVAWKSEDTEAIKRLMKKYGDKPKWFGYRH